MHFTEYWAIVERDHTIQNPSSPEKLALLAEYCRLRDGLRILDVGCGKGWLLRTWASQWAIDGTGLEINPHFVATARSAATTAGLDDRVRFVEGPALDFEPEPHSYDVVMCIGAAFALGDYAAAVPWMRRALRPGGVLAIGEVFANELPFPPEMGDEFARDLATTVGVLSDNDLDLTGMIVASLDDWDRYESQHWRAVHEWAAENPDHADRDELLRANVTSREHYLRWQRRYLGWAIFVARHAQG